MTDSQWSNDAPAPKKKKGLPGWLWFCGAGCLLLVILLGVLSFFSAKWFKSGLDPAQQWPKLQRILPFEEQPTGLELPFGQKIPFQDVEMFVLHGHGLQGVIFSIGSGSQKEIAELMDPSMSGGLFGMGAREDMELVEMTIQGEEYPALHYYQSTAGQQSSEGQALMLDLSQLGSSKNVFLQLGQIPGMNDSAERTKFTQEQVELFLSEFDL